MIKLGINIIRELKNLIKILKLKLFIKTYVKFIITVIIKKDILTF